MYEYKTEPYDHQRKVFEESREREAFALLMEMGCGKSKVIVDTMAFLFERNKLDAALIIAPNGVHRNWALKEFSAHLPDRIQHQMVVWESSKNTKAYKEKLHKLFNKNSELKILLMNVEAFSSKKGGDFGKKFAAAFGRMMVVIDESSKIKNVKAKRTKTIVRLREQAAYRRILTGTPVTQNHLDVYPQYYFLDPKILNEQSFHTFKHYYSVVVKQKMWRNGANGKKILHTYEDVVRPRNMDELKERIDPYSYRVTKEECLDLPPKIYTEIPVLLRGEQLRLYNKLKSELLLEADGEEIPIVMQLTRLLRLQQIVGGFVTSESGDVLPIDGANVKLEALLDDLDVQPTNEQAVIWARFRAEIELIRDALDKLYGAGCCGTYYGGVSGADRAALIDSFQAGDTRFFIATQQAGAMGLTLTAASLAYYYSNSFSLEDRLQSIDRLHRIGQHKPVVYKDIVGLNTIDRRVVSALMAKLNIADLVTGDSKRLREFLENIENKDLTNE